MPYLEEASSRIHFKNQGGLMNGGVCWWHNRLQRASAYLVEFKPEMPAAGQQQVEKILADLKRMKKVVVIPGFKNFDSFTQAHQKEVQKLLEGWQKEDGFLNQQWARGISGKYELEPKAMQERMNSLYQQFLDSPHPVWVMAQIKGISSHAFLILDMVPVGKGYEVKVIDSNYPTQTKSFTYVYGQKFLKHPKDKYSFIPYLGFQKDFDVILASVKDYCGEILNFNAKDIPKGQIEVGR